MFIFAIDLKKVDDSFIKAQKIKPKNQLNGRK